MRTKPKEKRGRGISNRTDRVRGEFLTLIANGYSIKRSCIALEISRTSVHKWLREDAEFAEQYAAAQEDQQDELVDEAWRRAVNGVRRVDIVNGKTLYRRVYSDRLLERLLEAKVPGFKDKAPGVVVNNNTLSLGVMTPEQLADAMAKRGLPVGLLEE